MTYKTICESQSINGIVIRQNKVVTPTSLAARAESLSYTSARIAVLDAEGTAHMVTAVIEI